MIRDIALAALAGPGLVLGIATTLDRAQVLDLAGLTQRLLAVLAVAIAVGTFIWLHGDEPRSPGPRRRRPRRLAPRAGDGTRAGGRPLE